MLDPNDGGWKSRKLWFSVFTSLLIFAGAVYGSKHSGFDVLYPELTMGLIGVASLFFGANTFGRWTIARNAKGLAEAKNLIAGASDKGGDPPPPAKDDAPAAPAAPPVEPAPGD